MNTKSDFVLKATLTAIIISILCIFVLRHQGWDFRVIAVGNLIVALTSIVSFLLLSRSLTSPNSQQFLRGMYGSFILKFFVIAIAAFVYIQVEKKQVNRPAIFTCLGLYVLYTTMEIVSLFNLLKRKKRNG
jgi:hypothetical protein